MVWLQSLRVRAVQFCTSLRFGFDYIVSDTCFGLDGSVPFDGVPFLSADMFSSLSPDLFGFVVFWFDFRHR